MTFMICMVLYSLNPKEKTCVTLDLKVYCLIQKIISSKLSPANYIYIKLISRNLFSIPIHLLINQVTDSNSFCLSIIDQNTIAVTVTIHVFITAQCDVISCCELCDQQNLQFLYS